MAAFVESDEWEEDGSATPYDWIRINCHLTGNAVYDRATVGEKASELVESMQAMEAGDIGFAHLAVMARTAEAVGERFDEGHLLKLAKAHSAGKFHFKCLHYRHAVAPDSYPRAESEIYEKLHHPMS